MSEILILFDLDGTLVDTAPELAKALNQTRATQNLSALPLEKIRPFASKGARGLLNVGFNLTPDDDNFEDLKTLFLKFYQEEFAIHSQPFSGVIELLNSLESMNIRWGVVTNKHEYLAIPLLKKLGLFDRAAVVLGSDHVGCAMKPAPDSLLLAMKLTQSPSARTFYCGDDPRDIEAAKRANISSIAASWGYWQTDPSLCNPDKIARDPIEIILFVKHML